MRMPDTSEILLLVQGVSLAFGGVKALRDVSFDIRKGEIRAIIGPNGAGKTSMLNVINGFYHPNHGAITFKGRTRAQMQPYEASRGGIARTFQNVALFKGMSALDNIMAGRTLKMRRGLLWQMLRYGPALAEEIEHRHRVEEIIDFLEIEAIRKVPVARLPYGLQKRVELGRALAMEPAARVGHDGIVDEIEHGGSDGADLLAESQAEERAIGACPGDRGVVPGDVFMRLGG